MVADLRHAVISLHNEKIENRKRQKTLSCCLILSFYAFLRSKMKIQQMKYKDSSPNSANVGHCRVLACFFPIFCMVELFHCCTVASLFFSRIVTFSRKVVNVHGYHIYGSTKLGTVINKHIC